MILASWWPQIGEKRGAAKGQEKQMNNGERKRGAARKRGERDERSCWKAILKMRYNVKMELNRRRVITYQKRVQPGPTYPRH